MAQASQRKCMSCEHYFTPNPRARERQRYCSAQPCQRVRKARNQQAWLARGENQDYFRGPEQVARVQAWRAAHPGYARGRRRGRALQDEILAQPTESTGETGVRAADALQAAINPSRALLTGLVAHVFQVTLQVEIAETVRRLVQLGGDVLGGGDDVEAQMRGVARARAPGAEAVQLD